MIKSKFIEILRSFSPEEQKMFRNFVRSPFHNSNKNVIKLYEIARKYAPDFDSESLIKDKLFNKIYPSKQYNDTVMRILLSDLLRLGEEFLIYRNRSKGPAGDSIALLEELKERNLESLFRKTLKETKEKLNESEDVRSKYFSLFELEIINVDFHLRNDRQQLICGNVLSKGEYLLFFTLIELTRIVHDLIINEKTFNAKFETNLVYEFFDRFDFNGILEKIRTAGSEHYPVLNLYYNLLMAMRFEEVEEYYDNLKSSLQGFVEGTTDMETARFLFSLESCCLNRMKYNPEKYKRELFNIYKIMLSTETFSSTSSKEMTIQRFKNILIGAINVGELEWCKEFIEKYYIRLHPDNRESMRAFGLALVSFGNREFEKALDYLSKVKYDYFVLKMDVKSWMVKIYYELGYMDSAISLLDSYKHFITKNTSVSEHFKERHLNFIRFASELIKIKSGSNKAERTQLFSQLEQTGNVVHSVWLSEKVSSLK